MKFKVAVVSLLTAIMVICGYTGYRLIQEAEKQTTYQQAQSIALLTLSAAGEEEFDYKISARTIMAKAEGYSLQEFYEHIENHYKD